MFFKKCNRNIFLAICCVINYIIIYIYSFIISNKNNETNALRCAWIKEAILRQHTVCS